MMSPKRSARRVLIHPLSLAMASVTALPLSALAADPVLADGRLLVVPADTYDSVADNGPVLQAINAGTLSAIGALTVNSTHAGAHGVVAQGASSSVSLMLPGTLIHTIADNTHGLVSRAGGIVALNGGSVRTDGVGSSIAAMTGASSQLLLINSDLATNGAAAHGIHMDDHANAQMSGGSLITTGTGAVGLLASGAGTRTEIIAGATFDTAGEQAHAVATDVGSSAARIEIGSTAQRVLLHTRGDNAEGIHIDGQDHVVTTSATDISTLGATAHAINALATAGAGNTITAADTTLTTSGNGARAVSNQGAAITLDTVEAITSGDNAHGLYAGATTAGTQPPTITATQTTVTTHGTGSAAVLVEGAAAITLNGSTLATTGDSANAASSTASGVFTANNLNATTSGSGSDVLAARDGGSIIVNSGQLHATGTDAAALRVTDDPTAAGAFSTVTLAASTLQADAGAGIVVRGGAGQVVLTDSSVSGSNGALDIADAINGITTDGFNLSASNSVLQGNITDVSTGTNTVNLSSGSVLNGAVNGLGALQVNASQWNLTADSQLGKLDLINGTIAFDPTAAGSLNLVVDGDFHAENGLLQMNTVLADDSAATDHLHVKGSTSGNAAIAVNNLGGGGAQTVEGIQLVQVDGTSDAIFNLQGRAVAGAYEYFLHQGGVIDPADGNWYLRSELPVTPPPTCEEDGTCPPPPPPPTRLYRPEVGVYLTGQALATEGLRHSLHDRLGETGLDRGDADAGVPGSAWVRISQLHGRDTLVAGQLATQTRDDALWLGTHLYRNQEHGHFQVGIMGQLQDARLQSRSVLTGYSASGRTRVSTAGFYASWFADPEFGGGFYADAWAMGGTARHRVEGDALPQERYDANLWGGSLEAGYGIKLRDSGASATWLEPQLQVSYVDYSSDGLVEQNGTRINSVKAGGMQVRSGVRLFGRAHAQGYSLVQPFLTLNHYYNQRANSMSFDGETLYGNQPRSLFEVKGGAQLQLGNALTGWGQLGIRRAGAYRDAEAALGMKYSW